MRKQTNNFFFLGKYSARQVFKPHKKFDATESIALIIFLSWPMRLNFPQGFAEFLKNLIFLKVGEQ